MKRIIFFILLLLATLASARAQCTSVYPGALDTAASLCEPVDNKFTFLTAAAADGATTITVNSTAGVPVSGILQIDDELFGYTTASGTTFAVTRGFSNTVARPHALNARVRFPLVAANVNGPRSAALALETKLGRGASPASTASTGQCLVKQADGSTQWATCGSGAAGTVTSVALTAPAAVFDVAGSPVTSAGTLALTFDNQTANTVLSGPPSGSAAAPTFRALAEADVPTLSQSKVTNLTIDLAGKQPLDATLTSLAAFNSNGLIAQTAPDTFAARTLTGPAAGIGVTNGNGVSGNPTLSLTNDLAALESLASTGLATRTGTDTWAQRTITGTTNQVTVTNGSGVSGNPTLTLPQNIHTGATPQFAWLGLGTAPVVNFDVLGAGNTYGRFTRPNNASDVFVIIRPAGTLSAANPQYSFGIPLNQSYFAFQRWDGLTTPNDLITVQPTGDVTLGAASLATTATEGYPYIPSTAGVPTGVPTALAGRVPLVYDTANNRLCVYSGSWRCVAPPAGSIALTGQTAAIATTSIQCDGGVCPAGLYRLSLYPLITTAGSGGVLSISVGWNDGAAARTAQPAVNVNMNATNYSQGGVVFRSNGVNNITYSTTLTGASGSPVYSLYISLERIQ